MQALELIRDFVNTADLEAGEDKLADARGLQYWLVFHGLAELRDRATQADAADARALREASSRARRVPREASGSCSPRSARPWPTARGSA